MKFIPSTCPHCGANLKLNPTEQKAVCEYCGTTLFLDENTTRIEYVNAEQAGYNFEKGRLRAQSEQPQAPIAQQVIYQPVRQKPKKRHTFWWIMGWIFIFPIPATILITRNKKMNWIVKAILLIVVWGLYLAIGMAGNSNAA